MVKWPRETGNAQRARILAELARRWEEFEEPPVAATLAVDLGMGQSTLEYHLRALRADGLVHPGRVWITRQGYNLVFFRSTDDLG